MKKIVFCHFLFIISIISACQATHNIQVSQKDFSIVKMEHLQAEKYNFEAPNIEKKGDAYLVATTEIDKIIRNNKRFKTIIKNIIKEANTKLAYYEDILINHGAKFE